MLVHEQSSERSAAELVTRDDSAGQPQCCVLTLLI